MNNKPFYTNVFDRKFAKETRIEREKEKEDQELQYEEDKQ